MAGGPSAAARQHGLTMLEPSYEVQRSKPLVWTANAGRPTGPRHTLCRLTRDLASPAGAPRLAKALCEHCWRNAGVRLSDDGPQPFSPGSRCDRATDCRKIDPTGPMRDDTYGAAGHDIQLIAVGHRQGPRGAATSVFHRLELEPSRPHVRVRRNSAIKKDASANLVRRRFLVPPLVLRSRVGWHALPPPPSRRRSTAGPRPATGRPLAGGGTNEKPE